MGQEHFRSSCLSQLLVCSYAVLSSLIQKTKRVKSKPSPPSPIPFFFLPRKVTPASNTLCRSLCSPGRLLQPGPTYVCLEVDFQGNNAVILCLPPIVQAQPLHCSTSPSHFIRLGFGEIQQVAAELCSYWTAVHIGQCGMLLHHTGFTLISVT